MSKELDKSLRIEKNYFQHVSIMIFRKIKINIVIKVTMTMTSHNAI